jgi:hypothetical protein
MVVTTLLAVLYSNFTFRLAEEVLNRDKHGIIA